VTGKPTMPDRKINKTESNVQVLHDEIKRLNKIVTALIHRAERANTTQCSDFSLFQTTILLEDEVRHRTNALEAALRENEKVTRALRESEVKFQRLVEQSLVGIALSDNSKFIYVNPRFTEITGYSTNDFQDMRLLDVVPEKERARIDKLIHRGFSGEARHVKFISEVLCKNKMILIMEVAGGPPVNIGGKPAIISVWSDITERVHAEEKIKLLNAKLVEQAIHDPLTGLFNRRYLEETLERELIRAQRLGQHVSLVMGDLDHFKAINDTYGHLAGDEVLRTFAGLLKQHSRGSDMYCRYGGEEFILVMPDMILEKAVERTDLLRETIAGTSIVFEGVTIRVNASFGVASFPEHGEKITSLIAAADNALYRAKKAGRNRVISANGRKEAKPDPEC
jgi:diguanylate cyclase (GGDEF)-like protein/PAS domain S-box-containing protein